MLSGKKKREGREAEDLDEGEERFFSYRRVLCIYRTPLAAQNE